MVFIILTILVLLVALGSILFTESLWEAAGVFGIGILFVGIMTVLDFLLL